MVRLFMDIETYSPVSLPDCGLYKYASFFVDGGVNDFAGNLFAREFFHFILPVRLNNCGA